MTRGAWVAQSGERPAPDFGSGRELEPRVGLCADSAEPAWDSLSPPSASPLLARSLSLSK